ncbi:MAG: SPOR domain-containing protein [Thermodesulfobacteriota bacterium]
MSRDSSQGSGRILSFLFAFTVLFVLVFGLGVFVGKRLSRQDLSITRSFEEAPPEPSPTPVEETPDAGFEQMAESPAPAVEEAVEENAPPPTLPPTEEDEKVETETGSKTVTAPESAKPPAPAKQDDERLAEITREIERELEKKRPQETKEPEAAKPSLPHVDPEGAYTVQIGSFQDQKQANSLASALQSKGYPVFIKSMTSPDNKIWYRVRVGTFKDLETAKAYGESLKSSEPGVKLVFITINN